MDDSLPEGFIRPEDVTVKDMAELERIFASRRDNLQSIVVERRDYHEGMLQLELRRTPATGKVRGPYW
jgi:hypothetical protein